MFGRLDLQPSNRDRHHFDSNPAIGDSATFDASVDPGAARIGM